MARTLGHGDEIFGDFLLNSSPFKQIMEEKFSDSDVDDIMCIISSGEMTPNQMNKQQTQNMENQVAGLNNKENTERIQEKPQNARFKEINGNILDELDKYRQSESTKRNTTWCIESGKPVIDLKTVDSEYLAVILREFYASATPVQTEKRKRVLPENQAIEYHKNSLKSIRATLNRRLRDLDRNIDISRDSVFYKANATLNAKLKYMVKTGASRPTQHKKIILNDMVKINSYLLSTNDPQILMYKVWFSLAIHFVTRGLEFHQQLTLNSFSFNTDETGRQYVTLTHETKQKNIQGGISDPEAISDKRMYATGREGCPVEALKSLLSHCDPTAEKLFCRVRSSPVGNIWYTCKPISQRMFTEFMSKIGTNSGCTLKYTSHSLRATAIQTLSDAGVELRHIMQMSDHRNEASIRSYSRDCSTIQKHNISDTLSGQTSTDTNFLPVPSCQFTVAPSAECASTSSSHESILTQQSLSNSLSSFSKTFLNNGAFHNCNFNFNFASNSNFK